MSTGFVHEMLAVRLQACCNGQLHKSYKEGLGSHMYMYCDICGCTRAFVSRGGRMVCSVCWGKRGMKSGPQFGD